MNRNDLIRLCQDNSIDLIPFDDGHVPLNFTQPTGTATANNNCVGCIARSSQTTTMSNTMLHVIEDALPQELADEIFLTTTTSSPEMTRRHSESDSADNRPRFHGVPWGEYVTMKEALDRAEQLRRQPAPQLHQPPQSTYHHCLKAHTTRTRKEIAVDAVAQFFILRIPDQVDWKLLAHGVAVWVLAADIQSEVEYHIDYAELVRYEYNIIYPPLYGATVHCSRLWSTNHISSTEQDRTDTPNNTIVGGEFVAFMEGFPHYERHGYKGRKLPVDYSSSYSNDIRVVPYKFNQGILLHGEIPHLSTPIQSIEPRTIPRVIMGFNVFDTVVGPFVAIAPEHSSAFNRRIKIYQMIASSTNNGSNRLDLNFILNNKPLAKLLVQAKREKLKRQFQQDQQLLQDCILQLYQDHKERATRSEVTPLDSLSDFDDLVITQQIFDSLANRMENKKLEAADILYAINKFRSEKRFSHI